MRTPVDEIPDSEEAVAAGVKRELGQGALKRSKAPVHVADHEVSTGAVDADDASRRGDHRLVSS